MVQAAIRVLEGVARPALHSHGFGAHTLAQALSRARPALEWTALAGSEFDALLGQGGAERARLLLEAQGVVVRASHAWFVGARASHVYARLCQTARRRVDRWPGPSGDESADAAPAEGVVVAVAGPEPLRAWASLVQAPGGAEGSPQRVRLLAWGERYAQLLQEVPEDGVEVVGVYAPPRNLARVGRELWVMADDIDSAHRIVALRGDLRVRALGHTPPRDPTQA